MQVQTTLVEKLILSALIAFVTATASATMQVQADIEHPLPNLNPLLLAAQ